MTFAFTALSAVAAAPESSLIAVFAATTALAGVFVAALAYRGYRRNESRPMLFLALGVALLTAVPVGTNYVLLATAATDAQILLVVALSHLAGVATVLYALTRA